VLPVQVAVPLLLANRKAQARAYLHFKLSVLLLQVVALPQSASQTPRHLRHLMQGAQVAVPLLSANHKSQARAYLRFKLSVPPLQVAVLLGQYRAQATLLNRQPSPA
jgi:hypothetical protein